MNLKSFPTFEVLFLVCSALFFELRRNLRILMGVRDAQNGVYGLHPSEPYGTPRLPSKALKCRGPQGGVGSPWMRESLNLMRQRADL